MICFHWLIANINNINYRPHMYNYLICTYILKYISFAHHSLVLFPMQTDGQTNRCQIKIYIFIKFPILGKTHIIKCHGPLRHWRREGKTLVVRPLKQKTFFLCVSSLSFHSEGRKLYFYSLLNRDKYWLYKKWIYNMSFVVTKFP